MHADGETDGGSASEPSAEPEPPEPGSPQGVPVDPGVAVVDVRCPTAGMASGRYLHPFGFVRNMHASR